MSYPWVIEKIKELLQKATEFTNQGTALSSRVATLEQRKVVPNFAALTDTTSTDLITSPAYVAAQIKTPELESGLYSGDIRLFSFRANQLPSNWFVCDGTQYAITSPAGIKLSALTDEFKADWRIVTSGGFINVPNLYTSDWRGYFLRPIDGTTRLPGSIETDAIRNITGSMTPTNGDFNEATGAFTLGLTVRTYGSERDTSAQKYIYKTLYFDAAKSGVPTASENRSVNIGMTPAIYLKVT